MSDRRGLGLDIAKSNSISENEDGSFSVPSQTRTGVSYQVKLIGEAWVCECPDFMNRADMIDTCKHVFAVKFWIASRVELQSEPRPRVFAEDAVQCPCGSIRVVKYGRANGKQVFKCRDCGKKFREGLIKKAHYSPETITLTLDLYFSGLSLRKITRTVNDHFDMNLGKSSVYRWIQTFVPKISEYAKTLTPRLSDTWHADELFVKMKGAKSYKDNGDIAFLWNVMDRKTRFLLASRLSEHRSVIGATLAFKQALEVAHANQPERVFTDSARAYNEGIKNAFGANPPEHVARVGIRKPHANNNRIERLNGTLRERVKVQRGWKSYQTPIAEGQRIHYNFVKPHQALEGQTPAERAGIRVRGKNKWLTLIQNASKGSKISPI